MARQIGGAEFTSLATYLGVPYSVVQQIMRDYRNNKEQIVEILKYWRDAFISGRILEEDAVQQLNRALLRAGSQVQVPQSSRK